MPIYINYQCDKIDFNCYKYVTKLVTYNYITFKQRFVTICGIRITFCGATLATALCFYSLLESAHCLDRSCASKIRLVLYDASPSPSHGRQYYALISSARWRKWLLSFTFWACFNKWPLHMLHDSCMNRTR